MDCRASLLVMWFMPVPSQDKVRGARGVLLTPHNNVSLWYEVSTVDSLYSFFFDVCSHFLHSYVRILSLWSFGVGDISPFINSHCSWLKDYTLERLVWVNDAMNCRASLLVMWFMPVPSQDKVKGAGESY